MLVNTMDVLSDVLRVVRLSGAVFLVADFTSPWAIESPPSRNLAPLIMPRAECFTIFHVLAEGTCWVRVKGEPPLKMEAGDVLVVPQGDVLCGLIPLPSRSRRISQLGTLPAPTRRCAIRCRRITI